MACVSRYVLQHGVKQRRQVGADFALCQAGPAVQAGGVNDREVELFFGCAKFVKEIEGGVDHVIGTGTRAVNLVDHDDGLEAQGQRLARDEAGLRHGAFYRVHQQQHAVDHRQHTFHLTTKVGVAGRINDVDVGALPFHGAVFRQDGDATLTLDVVAVHHPFGDFFVLAEGATLAQQLVHHRGFAMVDVGDDGDVADLFGHGRAWTSWGLKRRSAMSSPWVMWALPRKARGAMA